jgi:5-methylthioadenosine/S-adenosylhomocysteine deaminase
MVRADRAHMVPMLRPVSTWLHQGQPSDVTDVMVDGDWVMRDGRIVTMDEEAIVAEAQRIGVRAWGKLFAARPELAKPAGFVPV